MVRYETLRQQLIARRKQLDLTQKAVAERMGVHPTIVNKLELGKNPNPTMNMLATWCRVLDGRLDLGVNFDDQEPGMACGLDKDSPADACSCTDSCLKHSLTSTGTAQ
jgi:transcriptional regulator with XRE-family HTH domain